MNLQKLANSRFGVGLTLWIGRTLPIKTSYQIVDFMAKRLAKRDINVTRNIRANQKIVRGELSSPGELDQAVLDVLCHAGYCAADLYRNMLNPEGLKSLVPFAASSQILLDRGKPDTRGAFVVAPHLSAFDICLLSLAHRGLQARVLTYGNPPGGYELQNEIRASTGLEITPVRGEETHQEAVEYMRNGGVVITAVDRPIRKKAHQLTFFGHPSPLPAGHIRMAIQAGVPVIVAAAQRMDDGRYRINLSAPIEMDPNPDPELEIRLNAEAVLEAIEVFIRQAPEQWLMYYPVWPEMMQS